MESEELLESFLVRFSSLGVCVAVPNCIPWPPCMMPPLLVYPVDADRFIPPECFLFKYFMSLNSR